MRPIKFRAWLEDKQEMYYQYDNTASAMNGLSRFAEVVGSQVGYTPEVMQFTGLLDKNGKEIYEGDIVLFPDTESEFVDVGIGNVKVAEQGVNAWGVVKMQDYSWGLDIQMKNEVIGKGFYSFNEIDQNIGLEDFEIIGNIYENPEIIK